MNAHCLPGKARQSQASETDPGSSWKRKCDRRWWVFFWKLHIDSILASSVNSLFKLECYFYVLNVIFRVLATTRSPNRSHSYTYIHTTVVRGNLRFIILPKDALTCRMEEPETKPPTLRSVENLLFHLSHIQPFFLMIKHIPHMHEHIHQENLTIKSWTPWNKWSQNVKLH